MSEIDLSDVNFNDYDSLSYIIKNIKGGGDDDYGVINNVNITISSKEFTIDRKLSINNSTLIIASSIGSKLTINGARLYINNGSTLNIIGSNGTLNINIAYLYIENGGTLKLTGKLYINSSDSGSGKLYINGGGNLNIESNDSFNIIGNLIINGGNLNINGGNLNINDGNLNIKSGNMILFKGLISTTKNLNLHIFDTNYYNTISLNTYNSMLSSFGVNETLDGYLIDGTQATDSKTEYVELLKKQLLSLLDSRLTINTKVINWVEQTIEDYKNMRTTEETQKVNDKELETYNSVLSSFSENGTTIDSKDKYGETLYNLLKSVFGRELTTENNNNSNWPYDVLVEYKNMRTTEETQKVIDKELETYNSVLSSFGVNKITVKSKDEYNKKLYDQFKDLLNSKLTNIKTSKINWPEIAITDEISKLNDEITGLKEEIEDIDLNNLKEKINLLENNLSSIDTKIQKLILFSLINVKNI